MRRLVVSIVSALLFASLAQAKPDFSGTWILDKAKSDSPKSGGRSSRGNDAKTADPNGSAAAGSIEDTAEGAEVKLVIEQTGDSLKVTRSVGSGEQSRSSTFTLDLSGKEIADEGQRGGKFSSKSNWEGESLVLTSTRTRKNRDKEIKIESKQVWSLSADAKILTIAVVRKGPRGEKSHKSVYAKAAAEAAASNPADKAAAAKPADKAAASKPADKAAAAKPGS